MAVPAEGYKLLQKKSKPTRMAVALDSPERDAPETRGNTLPPASADHGGGGFLWIRCMMLHCRHFKESTYEKNIYIYVFYANNKPAFSFGDIAAAEQNPAGRNEITNTDKELRELQARVAELTTLMKDQGKSPLAAPFDAGAGPCYEGAYHANHDYRCYPGYRRHYHHH